MVEFSMGGQMREGSRALRLVDLFAGVGGLSTGFEKAGFQLVFANDNDHWAAETFKLNHPEVPFSTDDISELDFNRVAKDLEHRVDVLVGGVPCQAFSMAGYRIRKSREETIDERVYLFRHFVRAVEALLPSVVVIENVKGLPSMLGGAVIDEIQTSLRSLGYDVEWRYLNAADFGAPQIRQRTIVLANRLGVANEFPAPLLDPSSYRTVREAFKDLPSTNHEPRQLHGQTLERVKMIGPGQNWRVLPESLRTRSNHSGAYGRLQWDLPSRTLLTRFDSPPVGYVTHPDEHRALTVREGARLQGFEDDFVFLGPRMQQYKQVGNAVSPFLSAALARSVLGMFRKARR
jgi:DNA (cytosine-5)-methyltransferase 1